MRVGPTHEYIDSMMKQKVADSVIQRVVGHDSVDAPYQQQYQQQAAYQPQPTYQQQAAYQQAPYQQQQQQQQVSNGPKVGIFIHFSHNSSFL